MERSPEPFGLSSGSSTHDEALRLRSGQALLTLDGCPQFSSKLPSGTMAPTKNSANSRNSSICIRCNLCYALQSKPGLTNLKWRKLRPQWRSFIYRTPIWVIPLTQKLLPAALIKGNKTFMIRWIRSSIESSKSPRTWLCTLEMSCTLQDLPIGL